MADEGGGGRESEREREGAGERAVSIPNE